MMRLPQGLLLSLAVAASSFFSLPSTNAQNSTTATTAGCLRLLGSVACVGFEGAYIHPGNLSEAFPWMESVTTVAEFDSAALSYFSDPNQYSETQFRRKLGCSNATGATLRYARTVLCSMWTNGVRSQECLSLLDQSSLVDSPKMVCRQTCKDYAASENSIVENQAYCPGPDLTGGFRAANMTKDYVQCTNWTTLATNDTSVCVLGSNNEGNCGYGSSISQLCSFCDPSTATPDSCCYASNTNVGTCGYVLPALSPSSSSTIATPSSSASVAGFASSSRRGLSGGAIAGIVIGALVALLLLLLLLLLLCRRRKNKDQQRRPSTTPTFLSSSAAHSSESTFVSRFFGAKSNKEGAFAGERGTSGDSGRTDEKTLGLGVTGAALGAEGDRDAMSGGKDGLVHPGEVVTVLWAYSSTLPDELDLRPGMKLRIVRLYDDAWATGELVSGPLSGRQGAFPLVCVTLNGAPPSQGDASSIAPSRHSSDASLAGGALGFDSVDHGRYVSTTTGGTRGPSPLPLGRPLIASRGNEGGRPDSPLDPFDRP
ncbi:hypothetical protein BDY24DRAFT_171696 [Mrakia frigida]|uniref:uncharacterized protein n=1 Tax=Mrakia frigida TaxID=29902 RepID=UPI003FCBF761